MVTVIADRQRLENIVIRVLCDIRMRFTVQIHDLKTIPKQAFCG